MINASLGAHYSGSFVLHSIGWFWRSAVGLGGGRRHQEALVQKLSEQFGGPTTLTYKGRDAIELALRAFDLTHKDDVILTQSFTCFAIEEAILRAGASVGYADLGEGQLNLTVETLEAARKRAGKKAKAVIVQNSLGHPADMTAITRWCRQHSLILIEDLAQSYGATWNGQAVGTFGDVTVLSFGRDKVIDGVSGGATVFRTPPVVPVESLVGVRRKPPYGAVLKDLAYPFWTWLIRVTYGVYIGKLIHRVLTLVGLMTNPTASPTRVITTLPEGLAALTLQQLDAHEANHSHRQTIAALYLEGLHDSPVTLLTTPTDLRQASLLRVAAAIETPVELVKHLKRFNVHLSDRWYRTPVDSGTLNERSVYKTGSCPQAEQRAATIINLPTHEKISVQDAIAMIARIQEFRKT